MEFLLAYIDPGSGSLLIQGLIAALVAIPVFFRHQIARIVQNVRGKGAPEPSTGPASDDPGSAPRG